MDGTQNNDLSVNSKPQINYGLSDTITNNILHDSHNSRHVEHQPFTTTQPIINSFCNSTTIDPEANEEKEETSKIENSSSNGSSGEYGLELWNKRREMWIRGNNDNLEASSNRNNPALANITPNNYHSIYDSLIYEKKKLAKPVPLPYVVRILPTLN